MLGAGNRAEPMESGAEAKAANQQPHFYCDKLSYKHREWSKGFVLPGDIPESFQGEVKQFFRLRGRCGRSSEEERSGLQRLHRTVEFLCAASDKPQRSGFHRWRLVAQPAQMD